MFAQFYSNLATESFYSLIGQLLSYEKQKSLKMTHPNVKCKKFRELYLKNCGGFLLDVYRDILVLGEYGVDETLLLQLAALGDKLDSIR